MGLDFNYDWVKRTPNTMLVHRLIWAVAYENGGPRVLATRLFTASFTDGLDLSDYTVRRRIAVDAGLSDEQADAGLDGDLGDAEVRCLTQDVHNKRSQQR